MRLLHWIVSILAILAVIFLPALMAKAPIAPARQWTIGQLAAEGVHVAAAHGQQQKGQRPHSLGDIVKQAEAMQREFGVTISPAMKRAATLGALIPVAAVVAGICVVLGFLWLGLDWRWFYRVDAIVGLLACAYAIAASWLLTRAAQAAVAHLLAQAQHGLGGILSRLGVQLPPTLQTALGIEPQVGLYVLGLLFLAMLVLPAPRRA